MSSNSHTLDNALDARMADSSAFRAYLVALPDDGSVIAPTVTFADRAKLFIGFAAGEIPPKEGVNESDDVLVLSCWFPVLNTPKFYDFTVKTTGEEALGSRLDDVTLDPLPAFLECPGGVWEGWERVVLVGPQAQEAAEGVSRLFRGYIESIRP